MQVKLAPDLSLLAIMVIFILNYLVVRRYFVKPIGEVLDARAADSSSAEKIHDEALARFNAATAEMEERLHGAKRDAAGLREGFRREAAAHRNQVIERTGTEARELIAEAEAKLAGDVAVARESIVRESDSLARLAAERILGRAI